MDIIEAIILGIVQGITEFLPVSSSGHLQIAKEVLGVELENNVTFDVMLHTATVCSTILILWREIARILQGLFTKGYNEQKSYVVKIIISMIPAGIIGVLFSDQIEMLFSSLTFVGCMLLLTAVLLLFAYYAKPRLRDTISYRDSLIIGLAQAAATMPGLSRSGSTIATGLLLGNKKDSVANFSFLMVIPVILGKMILDISSGELTSLNIDTAPLVAGFIAAFISGALACRFMIEIVKRGKLVWFAVYCLAMGAASLIYTLI